MERRGSQAVFRSAQQENGRQWLQAAAGPTPVGLTGKTLPGVSGLAQEQDALGDGKTSTFMAFDNLGG